MESFPSAPSMDPWPRQLAYLLPDSTARGVDEIQTPPRGAGGDESGLVELDVGRSTMVTLKSPDVVRREQDRLLAELGEECGALWGLWAEARAPLGLAGLVRGAIPEECRVNSGCVAKCLGKDAACISRRVFFYDLALKQIMLLFSLS